MYVKLNCDKHIYITSEVLNAYQTPPKGLEK